MIRTEAEENLFVKKNLGLIYKIANLYQGDLPWMYYDDIVSACYYGFLKAMRSFDETRGTAKFSTYACRCMRNEVFMAFKKLNVYKPKVSLDVMVEGEDGVFDAMDTTFLVVNDDIVKQLEIEEAMSDIKNVIATLEHGEQLTLLHSFNALGQEIYHHTKLKKMLNNASPYIIKKKALAKLKTGLQCLPAYT